MSRAEIVAGEVLGVLIPKLGGKYLPTLSYKDMCVQIEQKYGDHVEPWRGLDHALGLIQEASASMGIPSLSICVVKKDGGKPGQGWYTSFDNCYPELSELSDVEKRVWLQNQILSWRDWRPLLERFGVTLPESEAIKNPAPNPEVFFEGASSQTEAIRFEVKRDRMARIECLKSQGTRCAICGFDSVEVYGVPGIIDVHHLTPICEGERMTDPSKDLIPVCPTCHRVIHSKPGGGSYTPDEVREMLNGKQHGENCFDADSGGMQ